MCGLLIGLARESPCGLRCLTFELSGRRRQEATPGLVKMYRVPPARESLVVGAPFWRRLGVPAPEQVYEGSNGQQNQGEYVRLDDRGQGRVVAAN